MFTLAHLSDIHLALRVEPRIADLLNKRMTGFLNLKGNRASHHQDWAVDALVGDLKAARPDHVALTGDLVNIALDDEFLRARDWLKSFGAPDWVSLVPGNHDTYVRRDSRNGIGMWTDYMRGDASGEGPPFPYLRKRGDVAFIGLSSAVATPPFMATGALGGAQIETACALLSSLGEQGYCRVVLIHHPPLNGLTKWRKRLVDANAFETMIATHGAELVLHGHNHTDTLAYTPGPDQPGPVVGVPSASSLGYGHRPAAQYKVFSLCHEANRWSATMTARQLDPETGTINALPAHQIFPRISA